MSSLPITELKSFLESVFITTCLKSKKYTNKEKIKNVMLIYEGTQHLPFVIIARLAGKLIFPKLKGVSNSLVTKLNSLSSAPQNQRTFQDIQELKNLKQRYDEIMSEYDELKEKGGTVEELKTLQSRAKQLKDDIEEFLQRENEYRQQQSIKEPANMDEIEDDEEEKPSSYLPKTIVPDVSSSGVESPSGSSEPEIPYGSLIEEIDTEARELWNDIAFTKCSQYSGKDLWHCRLLAANKAIAKIKSRVYKCNKVTDVDGCREALKTLIDEWEERKKNYSRK